MSRDGAVSFPGGFEGRREEFMDADPQSISDWRDRRWATLAEKWLRDFEDEKKPRGSVLQEAINTINGQRQDSYGNPEDSFERIANLWDAYLTGKYRSEIDLTAEDVALMMTLMKIARMMTGSGHRDSYIDAAGYIGLAADMGAK